LWNISTPVTTTFLVAVRPTISTSSLILTIPREILPVATVPRPLMEKGQRFAFREGGLTVGAGAIVEIIK